MKSFNVPLHNKNKQSKMQNSFKNTSFYCGVANPFEGFLHQGRRTNL